MIVLSGLFPLIPTSSKPKVSFLAGVAGGSFNAAKVRFVDNVKYVDPFTKTELKYNRREKL